MSSSANADDPVTADADKISGTTPNTGCPAFAGHDSEGSCAARPLWYRMPGAGKSVVPIGSRRSSNQTARQGPSRCTCRTCSCILAAPVRPSFAKATVTKSQVHEKQCARKATREWSAGRRRVVGHATRTDVATRPRVGRGARHRRSACANRLLRARCASRRSTTVLRRGCRPPPLESSSRSAGGRQRQPASSR